LTNTAPYGIIIIENEREVITMKVNYGNAQTGIIIKTIPVGETFFADRKSVKAKGIYLKVDGGSGLVKQKYGKSYAVNLETGRLREFNENTLVDRVATEVTFPKNQNKG
jgi:ribosomal protein L2